MKFEMQQEFDYKPLTQPLQNILYLNIPIWIKILSMEELQILLTLRLLDKSQGDKREERY